MADRASGESPAANDAIDEDEEWTFALDEVGPEGVNAEPPLEPEAINPEHAVFFLLGVALFLGLVIQVIL
jgi:hypothetical protein